MKRAPMGVDIVKEGFTGVMPCADVFHPVIAHANHLTARTAAEGGAGDEWH